MRLRELNSAHLTYCTNVHPGESWAEVERAIQTHVREVKAELCPNQKFGVGLRLSAQAARDLEAPGALPKASSLLAERDLYVFTLNGFPYGAFHGTRVKEGVYEPDWTSPERRAYTDSLARILAALLPSDIPGSISTVPGCFKPRADETRVQAIVHNLLLSVATLVQIEREQGSAIALALEPEPHCLLETSVETVDFFEQRLFAQSALDELARLCACSRAQAEALLRRHLGVCLDTCHAAVEFESPLDVFMKLCAAGITVPKIQISAGLRISDVNEASLAALSAFAEDVYLHQTVVGTERGIERYLDLPEALARAPREGSEWRVHFHVPIFHSELGAFASTQAELLPLLSKVRELESCPHLEVETYTFGVLPPEFRDVPVARAIVHELSWTLSKLGC